jgi:hypothetical protein
MFDNAVVASHSLELLDLASRHKHITNTAPLIFDTAFMSLTQTHRNVMKYIKRELGQAINDDDDDDEGKNGRQLSKY